jgi:hypothetical protein
MCEVYKDSEKSGNCEDIEVGVIYFAGAGFKSAPAKPQC